MHLLIFEWSTGTYTHDDIVAALDNMGITHHTVSYAFDDVNEDDFFEWRFGKCIDEGKYDAVYSTNYFPLVAKCCHNRKIRYVSWSYDNPLDVPDIQKTLGYEENRVFLFDKIAVSQYRKQGFDNVFHMPLAANVKRLDGIKLTSSDIARYSSEISFVGKLYESPLGSYMQLMDEYTKGFINAIIQAQKKIYGYYFVEELLTDEVINRINSYIQNLQPGTMLKMSKEALSYAMGAQITREDRLMLLKLLGMHHQVKLYSREDNELLKDSVQFMGSCGYKIEMPKIFKASKVNLNINLRVSQSGIPLRVMDVLGSGGFLISSFQPELAEFFVNGRDIVLYDSIEDAYEKVAYYLKHDDERQQIAINGKKVVEENYTYEHQLKEIFEIL